MHAIDDKTGILERELKFEIKNDHKDFDTTDSFNAIYNACNHAKEQIVEHNLNKIIGIYKL